MKYSISFRPNPKEDSEPKRYYANPIWNGICSTDELANEISLATTLSPADVKACIACFMQSIPQHLMKGEAVNCEGFGIFRLSFSVKEGHLESKDVSSSDIKKFRVLFRPCSKLKKQLESTPVSKR